MQLIRETACARLLAPESQTQPTLVRRAFEPYTERLWDIFVRACRSKRHGSRKAELRFYLEHTLVRDARSFYFEVFDPLPFLPQPSHHSFTEYAAYLDETFDGQKFGIVANNLHLFDPELWLASQPFLRRLLDARGVPTGGVSLDMFFGNYRQTPFGIHKDSQDVYTWVLDGTKRFHLWPFPRLAGRAELELARERLEARDAQIRVADEAEYRALLEDSVVLEGQPGDMMFWPMSWWHCADNPDGALALTVGAGIAFEGNIVTAKTQGFWDEVVSFSPAPPTTKNVAACLRRVARDEQIADFQKELAKAHLCARTGSYYFQVPPPIETPAPDDAAVLRQDARATIEWVALTATEWVIAANGHATTLAGPPAIMRALEGVLTALGQGQPSSVAELLGAFSGRKAHAREAAREVLRLLVSWRAVVAHSPAHAAPAG